MRPKNVLLIYDKETEKHFREVTSSIDGGDVETFYKVKLTYNLNQHNEIRNNVSTLLKVIFDQFLRVQSCTNIILNFRLTLFAFQVQCASFLGHTLSSQCIYMLVFCYI